MDLLTHQEPPPTALPAPLTLAELERRLQQVEPAALLVLPRILRRVIKQDRELTGLGLKVPHRKAYIVSAKRLLAMVDPSELGLSAADLPPQVLLIARPEPEDVSAAPAAALARTWRLLYHLRVHAALEERIAAGELNESTLRERIAAIRMPAFAEIRTVLRQEDLLLPPHNELAAYVEFAAVYLELKHFAPGLLESYFPALEPSPHIDCVLALDVDGDALLQETRLEGAPLPVDPSGPPEEHVAEAAPLAKPAAGPHRDDQARRLLRRAERGAGLGNVVRSAMLRFRAAGMAGPRLAEECRIEAQADIDRLVHRLLSALEIRQTDPRPWREALLDLLAHTTRGIWTAEARLLYDLQKVCVDYERDIYTVDLVEWALSGGKQPIQRPLPSQREVLMSKHLHSAARRLAAVRIPESRRRQLKELLDSAAARAEEQLRDRFRPLIAAALDDVGLKPANLPERVAQKKLTEELLDRVVDRGFLRMGDLRDALSRNNLKLPDFSGFSDFLQGDQLLRIDRRLGALLDGVYERGEVYLRWMQQLSSLAFGTRIGRFLTRFVAIPFGGSYVVLAGLQHVVELVTEKPIQPVPGTVAGDVLETAHQAVHQLVHVKTPETVLSLGLFFLLLLHVGFFRRAVANVLRSCYRVGKGVLIDFPRWAFRQPIVQTIVRSRPFTLLLRFVVKPLVFTSLTGLFVPLERTTPTTLLGIGVAIFLTMNLVLNSPLGRQVQEVIVDWLVQTWHRIGLRILTGLFYLVMDLFRGLLEGVERLLYAVDEWLRFKSGEGRVSLVTKGALGLVWFLVTYVVRFCVNLLIEPQINPIKHFPVVTVSHKLLLPFIPTLAAVLSITLENALALTIATVIITSIPGIFGFLVWELKENWRLYAANRRKTLGPVRVGSHGETMGRLLKPGFHSGTVPKLFARLRRAERKARVNNNWKATRKHRLALHHVELAIRRYVQREFIELVHQSKSWQGPRINLGKIKIATNQVLIEIRCPELLKESLWIALQQRSTWLVADVVQPGWFDRLVPQQRRVLNSALLGLYKTADVDVVCEQVQSQLGTTTQPRTRPKTQTIADQTVRIDFREEGLIIHCLDHGQAELLYPLENVRRAQPQVLHGRATRTWPELSRHDLLFLDCPVLWTEWVATWEHDAQGHGHPRELFAGLCVVPCERD